MKNTHLEHPEDLILTGDMSVLDWFTHSGKVSIKWDGAPAIVFGTDPENGKFFVGTKSVFNKKKIKINYSHELIDANHEGKVADILHVAFDCLPRIKGIVQGDFIGFGGDDTYRPNTITYKFDQIIDQPFIIACHTSYTGDNLRDVVASFDVPQLVTDENVYFVQFGAHVDPTANNQLQRKVCSAMFLSAAVDFVTEKQAKDLKIVLNRYIREGKDIAPAALAEETGYDVALFAFYRMIMSIKEDLMHLIVPSYGVRCFIDDVPADHEGYVMSNQYGTLKLVNRQVFSYNNFNLAKAW